MHTLQVMLVEADSKEEAVSQVLSRTGYYDNEGTGPEWSDWHEVGGRWGGYFEGSNVLCYADNVALAEETIKTALQWRLEEIERLKEDSDFEGLSTAIDSYDPENPVADFKVYCAKKVAEIALDYWTSDSKVFDLHDYTASIKYFRKRLEESPEKQYLVAVDFHF